MVEYFTWLSKCIALSYATREPADISHLNLPWGYGGGVEWDNISNHATVYRYATNLNVLLTK